ncbi:SDR family NAD(P)-dependent oxidoreductase [Rhizobium sp. NLR22b]|uniref:SDR family NAD(P)-dependent oxidoreductase n=1 Tax=Rhizobium sp. NLR22b TaxID=2731115 RepID=UPI001C84072C|nr:SDR family NAD(P)-dependent oxidoreductase [Rhizobium sp. NLR22b]MBX5242056.1 SDR family NAD(P)-dependent oxidoreductase [Rhizobium sp. NLR22b]
MAASNIKIQPFRKLRAPAPIAKGPDKAYGGEFTGEVQLPDNLPNSFIIFRHARTKYNPIEGIDERGEKTFFVQGRGIDPSIDSCGVKQALAGGFAMRHVVIAHVRSSPSQRAVQTGVHANIVRNATYVLDSHLQERSFGEHEGKMLPGRAFRGPYPGVEPPAEYTANFILPGLRNIPPDGETVLITHGGWLKGSAGALEMPLFAEHVGNAVPVRVENDGSGRRATRLRAIIHLALCQAEEPVAGAGNCPEEASNEGLEKVLEHYGLSLSPFKPRALVSGEDMSVIAEMRHGKTKHFDLDLRIERGSDDISWPEIIEGKVEQILIAKPDVAAVRLLISRDEDYSDFDGPAAKLLREVLDHFVLIGEAWNVDFEDVTLSELDETILSRNVSNQLALPRGVSTTSDNRVMLISGANRGIGLAIARSLILAGHLVSLGARNVEKLKSLFGEETERIHYAHFDAEVESTWKQWVDAAVAKFGRVDCLVNNAGCGAGGKADLMNGDPQVENLLRQVHVKAPTALVRLCMPHLRKTKAGRIIFINSASGKRVRGSVNLGYNAAKAEQLALAHTVHNEAWDDGVRVTTVCPGWVNTDLSAHSKLPDDDKTQPQEVAAIVAAALGMPNNADLGDIIVNCEHEPKR